MYDTTWNQFRHAIYDCFLRSRDALFELIDALLSQDQARSFPDLSLSTHFRRKWPSVYEALEDGRIDQTRLRSVLARFLPASFLVQERYWICVDASSIPRPYAHTSPDRGMVHAANTPAGAKPVTLGWEFSTLMVLPPETSSWTSILDQVRIPPSSSAVQIAKAQLAAVLPLLNAPAILVADSGYGGGDFVRTLHTLGAEGLLRLKTNRVFFRAPHTRSMDNRSHPDRFQCKESSTHGPASRSVQIEEEKKPGKPIQIDCWDQLYLKECSDFCVSVIRVRRPCDNGQSHESWFVWSSSRPAPLPEICQHYARRFSQEHCHRFLKQDLLWSKPHLRTPEQFERWGQLVLLAFNQLVLLKEHNVRALRPWEQASKPITPRQLRRAMWALLCNVAPLTRTPQPRGLATGRKPGAVVTHAKLHYVTPKSHTKKRKKRKTDKKIKKAA